MATIAGIGFLCLSLSAQLSRAAPFSVHRHRSVPHSTSYTDTLLAGRSPSVAPAAQSTMATPPVPGTLRLNFVNNMVNGPVYAHVTGMDSNNQLVMLTNQGEFYFPSSTGATPQNITAEANVNLDLGAHGQTRSIDIPNYISSARIWVSQGQPLQFGVTSGGLVEPSAANDQDPNHNTNWGFVELTFTKLAGLFANLSFVDFLGLPLGMKISSGNSTQSALGPHGEAVKEVCDNLKAQASRDDQPWHQLCKYDSEGNLVRVVSPQILIGQNVTAFENYFDEYVNSVYEQFKTTPLSIQTQESAGLVNCTTSASGDLTCAGDDTPFSKPKAADIFGCNSGPFANAGNAVHLATIPRVCAAFNRATFHLPGGNVQPNLPPSHYYAPPANNFYAAYVHQAEVDGKGYAFSYDDVTPDESIYNSAGTVATAEPEEMTIYVGGYQAK